MALNQLGKRLSWAAKTTSALGPRRLWLRLRYEVASRSGWLQRRYPHRPLSDWIPSQRAREAITARLRERGLFFKLDPGDFSAAYRRNFPDVGPALCHDADRLAAGEQEYFSHAWFAFDPRRDWFRNPFTGQVVSAHDHWTKVSWHAPESGDLKFQLEPARFGFVFKLARAYHYTRDERYAAAFSSILDGWTAYNPPQAGPLWICGQESAIRLFGMVFGLWAFLDSVHSTPQRVEQLIASIAAHADRIAGTTVYARSQQNNHALSEAAGLLTAGCLLAELPAAALWRRAGQRILEEQVPLQIYDDGSYIQHSHNYHRVMLHDLVWAIRVGQEHGAPLSDEVHRRVGLAARFLYEMLDPLTGRVPNYGPNDGALVLPLDTCPYGDYRPATQAGHCVAYGRTILPPGVWNEDLLWLFGPRRASELTSVSPLQDTAGHAPGPGEVLRSASFSIGGYDVLRAAETWAMVRCAHYRHRPSQADQLHLDVWWRGLNVACDAGAYLYNGSPPWDNGLARTNVHNTVSVDDEDQMTRGGRFLWLDWAQGQRERLVRSPVAKFEYWAGSHNGYRRLAAPARHRREVLRIGDAHWLVFDHLASLGQHRYRLHWLGPQSPHSWDEPAGRLTLDTEAGRYQILCGCFAGHGRFSLVSGDEHSTRGWRSQYYGQREPALSLALEVDADCACYWTLLGPPVKEFACGVGQISLATDAWSAEVELAPPGDERRIVEARWSSRSAADRLTLAR